MGQNGQMEWEVGQVGQEGQVGQAVLDLSGVGGLTHLWCLSTP